MAPLLGKPNAHNDEAHYHARSFSVTPVRRNYQDGVMYFREGRSATISGERFDVQAEDEGFARFSLRLVEATNARICLDVLASEEHITPTCELEASTSARMGEHGSGSINFAYSFVLPQQHPAFTIRARRDKWALRSSREWSTDGTGVTVDRLGSDGIPIFSGSALVRSNRIGGFGFKMSPSLPWQRVQMEVTGSSDNGVENANIRWCGKALDATIGRINSKVGVKACVGHALSASVDEDGARVDAGSIPEFEVGDQVPKALKASAFTCRTNGEWGISLCFCV